ncbi:hypothetical protein [Bacteroides neonati]|uniref:hypothetical protein n=1 Tax=Bacteroides neonati TaxID=1347393 RepID=UPI0004BC2C0D|nr:hypothetical protein [Bacteroides neonati]
MAKIIENFDYEIEDKHGDMIHVSARIEKDGGLYYWSVSHLTKMQDNENIRLYYASKTASTIGEAERLLNSYIKTMRRSKVVEPNEYYNMK